MIGVPGAGAFQPLIHGALLAGWSIRPTKKGYMLIPPDHTTGPDGRNTVPGIIIHKTPSDRRAVRNIEAMIRRYSTNASQTQQRGKGPVRSTRESERNSEPDAAA